MTVSKVEADEFHKHTNPVVDPEIWDGIENNHVQASKEVSSNSQQGNHACNTDIAENN